MERHFEQELDKLKKRLLKMGNLVYDQVHNSLEAMLTCDIELAQQVIDKDNKVDKLDVKIDKLCQRIFALTQPVATDLRLIMSALKMNNDLERLGDLAVNISEKIEGVSEYREILAELHVDELANMADLIVKDVVTIMNTRNTTFVKDIFASASAIEAKVQSVSGRILDEMMHKTEVIVVATNLMIILTQIDRIAGYSTNIAESIVFIVDGKMIKHKNPFKLEQESGPVTFDPSLPAPDLS
ncbi:MAG: phosphate signaling complex protein PhoU [Bacteroidetes bacterium]|nr:phosphate signaling complex protein PhoU [Bacteroidota bacterium]